MGPYAAVRDSMQREVLRLLASSSPEIIIVIPTGSRKSFLFIVMSVITAAEVTIIIIPLVTVRQDLIHRCTERGVQYWHYQPSDCILERLHAIPLLVLVDVEATVTPRFNAFAK